MQMVKENWPHFIGEKPYFHQLIEYMTDTALDNLKDRAAHRTAVLYDFMKSKSLLDPTLHKRDIISMFDLLSAYFKEKVIIIVDGKAKDIPLTPVIVTNDGK